MKQASCPGGAGGFQMMRPIYKLFYFVYRGAGGLWYWMRRRFTLAGLFVAGGCALDALRP